MTTNRLSLNQAIEIRESILTYLNATFTFQEKEVHNAFYNFITHRGIIQGYKCIRIIKIQRKRLITT